ncbi:calcitonin gene-related peptide type 1 receptor-like [Adelges cooleyi]|uniref:calcitonin gene-related peptide type 1 receptor-like n=1 Tax=Adelges cooleyi TaxID=133065 RepID=UPI00217F8AD7|nr:calcitonin gene-related peptide type 1 receptor-like [Adelges cooleyi]
MTHLQYGYQDSHVLDLVIAERRKSCEFITDGLPENGHVDGWCPREFDGWTCVNRTKAGEVASFPCPYFILGFDATRFGQKLCLKDGTWFRHPETNKTWSNYTTCVDLDDLKLRNHVNMIYKWGYTVSLAALLASIFIFFYFRSLTCTRIQIHKNLFISLAVNNFLWLVWYEAVVDNLPVLMTNGLGCKVLHVLVHYFLVATYFWMFCEGLYLHTLLVVTFITETKVMPFLHTIGWGVPALLVSTYVTVRTNTPGETLHCWIHESLYLWILSGPVCVSVLTNFVFLINIVRLLLIKLHARQITTASPKHVGSRERAQTFSLRSFKRNNTSVDSFEKTHTGTGRTGKAVRATLILIPLLGLQYMLMPFRPEPGTSWEPVYQVTSAVVVSFQGLCVALLFCFCNGEVLSEIKKRWKYCKVNKNGSWNPCLKMTASSSHNHPRLLVTDDAQTQRTGSAVRGVQTDQL